MSTFYFFKSSYNGDRISGCVVFTTSITKAITRANQLFARLHCVGEPQILAV